MIKMDFWDFLELFTRPEAFPYFFTFLTGYVLASLFAGNSSFWKDRDTFEKIIIGGALGFSLFYGIAFPIVILFSMWIELDIQLINRWSAIFLLVCFLLWPLLSYTAGISRDRIFKTFAYVVRFLPFASLLELFLTWIISMEVSGYPPYLNQILKPFWNNFILISVVSFLLIASINLALYLLFITPLWTEKYRPVRLIDPARKSEIKGWRHQIFLLKPSIRKKRIMVLTLITVIILPSVIIPIDQAFPFYTPRLHISNEFYYLYPYGSQELVLIRKETWKGPIYQYFGLMQRKYMVSIPNFLPNSLLVTSFYIENPSNFSEKQGTGSYPGRSSCEKTGYIWVSCPENVSYTFQPNTEEVTGVVINFVNFTESQVFNFNVTYYQQFLYRNVIISENQKLGEYQNDTRQESYYFFISNRENCTVVITYFEFDRLHYAEVIRDTIKVYINGTENPSITLKGYKIYPGTEIPAGSTMNLTIALLSQR